MRLALIAVAGIFISGSALAQAWTGTTLTPELLNGLPYTDSPIYGPYGGTVTPVAVFCHNGVVADVPGQCSAAQANANGRNWYLQSGPATRISALPNGIDVPGSKVAIEVTGIYADSNSASGVSSFSGYVPLSAFATSDQLDAANARIDAIAQSQVTLGSKIDSLMAQQSAIQTRQMALTRLTYRGVALASSLAMLAPAAGAHNRLGLGVGAYGNANAVSLNYTRQSGNVDFGAAAAWSSSDTLAKASVGLSW